MIKINSLKISGKECLPIIEGGKGIGISNGTSAGHFAKAGAVGTFSGVNATAIDSQGNEIPVIYNGKTRKERQEELIAYGIKGGISQAQIAQDISGGNGRIHMNVLWEMGGCERVLEGILSGAKGLVHGVTCGAGMPYRVSEIAQKYGVYYYPIVSSMRAFRALWKRSFHKAVDLLGAVVYECPWRAGGHNGLSNSEDPNVVGNTYERVVELRKFMDEVGLQSTPIIVAGGVWNLNEYENFMDNPEIGPVTFQFGTRPIVTQESPAPAEWKQIMLNLKKGDVCLNKFSPTGFYSSAIHNSFIKELQERSERQVEYKMTADDDFATAIPFGNRGRLIYIKDEDKAKVDAWKEAGFTEAMKTPDETVIFVTPEKAQNIVDNQANCMGCLSVCQFSNWCQHAEDENYSTGKKADPRSFCIQKTLQNAKNGIDLEHNLVFSGHNGYRFASDPLYANGYIPTIQELVDTIMEGK